VINNRYIIKKKLGEGRSKVFSAIDTEFPDKEIAIKVLPVSAKPDEKDSFREEFFRIKKFDHPNIIKTFEFGTVVTKDAEDLEIEYNSDFITLEYFPSKELLAYTELIDERKLKEILTQICAALYYLHQSNYIYYDLKPENILVSSYSNKPQIKLIDFGLAEYQLSELNIDVKGTAHYIAPELLKKEQHDHTVDLYSLGILLYRIVYGRFPFSADNEVDIYKAHIEKEFVFPPSRYSKELIAVIKKLLQKESSLRYHNTLELLSDLGIEINLEITKDFLPAKFFTNRKDAVNIIRSYLADTKSNEIYSLKGAEGSGKTALFYEIYENFENAILIENFSSKTGIDAVKYIFKKIFYSKVLYENYSRELSQELPKLFDSDREEFVQKIKVFSDSALKTSNPIILIDDFNLYDEFVKDVFKEVLPVFQLNNVKIVISENTNYQTSTNLFVNIRDFQISHFTDSQLIDFIEISYWQHFPKRELKKIIGLYSDLLPGNVKQFIKDLIVLGVLKYSAKEVSLHVSEELELALRSSNEEIYRIRLSNLSVEELKLAQLISAFEIGVEQTVLAGILGISSEKIKELISGLEKKNIIDSLGLSNSPRINSVSFKSYIYSTISSKTKYHLVIANTIRKLFPNFNIIELARHYELAGEFEKSAEVIKKEIELAHRISAFAYKKSLLEKVLSFKINENTKQEFLIELIKTNYSLSDYKSVLEIYDKLQLNEFDDNSLNEVLFIKAVAYKNLQLTEEANKIFINLLSKTDLRFRNKVLFEFADMEFDLGKYEKSREICLEIKNSFENLNSEDKGRLLNLLGLIEYNLNKDFENATSLINKAIKEFEQAKSFGKIAGIYVNLGIIYFEKGINYKTMELLNQAITLNENLGNFEQTGLIQLNLGVIQMELRNFELAEEYLISAKKIFKIFGFRYYYSLVMSNLGELYLATCDYENAHNCLIEARSEFNEIGNTEEELRVLFILGKFWFIIGDKEELSRIINQYEYYSYAKDSLSELSEKNYSYLKLMLKIIDNNNLKVEEILELIEKTSDSEVTQFGDIIFQSLEKMILNGQVSDVLLLLKSSFIKDTSDRITYFNAYRDYLLGRLVNQERIEGYNSSIEYFESAFNQLENESISELTWKVLVAITELYFERGNYHKAKRPRLYAMELMNMILESISNPRIRNKFLEKKERKEALELLKQLSNKVQANEFQQS
jgi:serine/threonine protein kinase